MKFEGIKCGICTLFAAVLVSSATSSPAQVELDCDYFSWASAGYSDPEAFLNGGWIYRLLSGDVPSHVIAQCVEIGVLGVNGRVTEDGMSVLHLAVFRRQLPIIGALLRAGANPNARHALGGTPLHIASNPTIITELLKAGADVNARTESGYTPLHSAVRGYSENVVTLLEAGADVDARDEDGNNSLHHWAASDGNAETLSELIRAGANVNARSKNGWTPLHVAAESAEEPRLVGILMDAGAQADAQTENGLTPWDLVQGNAALKGSDVWWRLNDARFE